jgi:hypothetical protein
MRLLFSAALLAASAALAAEPLRFASGPSRVALIELYTSEGCSSCPPADHWLSSLRDDGGLWTTFVPVEFHVNYWDSLGWKDRLSNPGFTAREYAYASFWGSPNVYTPCFVRNGAEWKPSWGSAGGQGGPAGELAVEVGPEGACTVTFQPSAPAAPAGVYRVHVALLGGGISSRVTAGENRGATLEHEFVVLGLAEKDLSAGQGPAVGASLSVPDPSVPGSRRRALAAWVTRPGDLVPVQATGGWLP